MTPIKPGDLVMIVKPLPCCGSTRSLGKPFTVLGIGLQAGHEVVVCPNCLASIKNLDTILFGEAQNGELGYCERSRVIRIDPPAQTETTREEALA